MERPTDSQIEDARNDALDYTMENRTKFPGMTYEEGIEAALAWVMGDRDEHPMED